MFERPPLPSLRKVLLRFQIFVKKAVLVGNFQEIQHVHDHLQMRQKKNLRQVCGKFFLARFNPRP